ncbi:MAG: 50S ribosomal protein L29 [Chloroflexi bacterium]|nr:50S ribosomal protein L29 [Chloroflexota bacterium]
MAEKKQQRARPKKAAQRKGASESIHEIADPLARVAELEQEMFHIRFQLATRQTTNTARIRDLRRTIARLKTVDHQRKLGAAMEAALAAAEGAR